MDEVGAIQSLAENYTPLISVLIVGLMGMVRTALPKLPSRFIPLINLVLGIGLTVSLAGFTIDAVFAGMMIGFAATGMYSSTPKVVKAVVAPKNGG